MALPLSGLTLDDEASIEPLSISSLIRRAPFHQSSRYILAHIIGNRLPARQKPRSQIQDKPVEELLVAAGGVCQLHGVCLDCFDVFNLSKLLCGSRLQFVARSEKYFLHREFRLLKAAAESGCHFCTLLLEAHEDALPSPDDRVYVQIVKNYDCAVEIYVTIGPRLGLYEKGLLPRYAGTKFDTSPSPGWFQAGGARSQPHAAQWCNFTGSGHHVALAKSWLSECIEKHQACKRDGVGGIIPARYIRIKASENGELQINLHITSDEDHGRPYCALSHCWGGATDILILKSSNIEDLKGNIDKITLAKSFQDAIAFTHSLGIEYIWIDCLCIIQDSKEDWLKESARMGDIYEGAACTIMAAAANDPHGGLFQKRNPLTYSPFRIAGSTSNGLFLLPHGQNGKIEEVLTKAPLQSRAWTFQESYLSPRKLYFGPNGIYWSCFAGEATERDPNGKARKRGDESTSTEIATIFGPTHVEIPKSPSVPPLMLGNGLVLTVTRGAAPKGPYVPSSTENVITGNISMNHGKLPRHTPEIIDNVQFWTRVQFQGHEFLADFHANWFEVVGAYSGRSLTKQGDKLIAISGIASRIKKDCGFEYFAGLWKDTMILDLLWHVDPHSNEAELEPRTRDYIAPSWSWASVKGTVTSSFLQPDLASVPLAEVKSVTVSTSDFDEDATGPVSNGTLTLIGKLKQASDINFSEHEDYGTSHRRANVYHAEREMGWVDYDVAPPSSDLPTFIVPVVEDTDWSFSHFPRIYGIAMVYHGTYFERVGAFLSCSYSKADGEDSYDWFHEGDYNEFEIR